MEIQLTVKSKSGGGTRSLRFPAAQPVVAGRNPEAAVPLEGTALSREHFSIECRSGRLYVADNSSNGTWVNGALVGRGQKRELRPEDVVEVAGYEINCLLAGEPTAPAAVIRAPASAPVPAGAWAAFRARLGPPLEGAEKFSLLLIAATAVLTAIYLSS